MEPVDREELLALVRQGAVTVAAVEMLRAEGVQAIRIEEGLQDFRAMGFSIAEGKEA